MDLFYYTSTNEMPMFNWNEINSTHNWKYLIKPTAPDYIRNNNGFKLLEAEPEDIWNEIWTTYIDRHGLNQDLDLWFSLMKEVCSLRIEVHLHGNTHLRPIYRAKEVEAADLMKRLEGGSVEETTALVSKNLGYKIDLKTTSVDQYMAYIKTASNGKN